MSHKQLLSGVIGLILLGGLQAACGRQAAPTQAPPTSSPTSASPTTPPVLSTAEPSPTMGEQIVSRDFSDFTRFSYAQESQSGPLCPSKGIFEAEISRRSHGDYLLKASIAEYGTLGVDQCFEGEDNPRSCTTIVQLPERTLTPGELDAVLDRFREIEIGSYDPWAVECDASCNVDHFTWDSFDAWAFCSGNLVPVQAQILKDLLDKLASKSLEYLPAATPVPPTFISTNTPAPTPAPSSGVLRGALIGAESQTPLAGAAIILCLVGTDRKCTLQADVATTTGDGGLFELSGIPPASYAIFYDPSGDARAGWQEIDGLEISLKIEGAVMFASPERTEFFSTFAGGETITISPDTSIGFDAEGNVTGEGSVIFDKYGLTLQFRDGQPLVVQVQRGKTTELEIMVWGL